MEKIIVILAIALSASSTFASFEGYDEIVERLSKYNESHTKVQIKDPSARETHTLAHLGLGVGQSFFDTSRSGLTDSRLQNQGGLVVNLGVDLFSKNWGLEGSFANFGKRQQSDNEIRLREFTLKGVYKNQMSTSWAMRLGMGFSSRFLDISTPQTTANYKTPSGLFTLGVDSYINSAISVGADLNFKTAMISDTIDRNSVDLTFRIDTHF